MSADRFLAWFGSLIGNMTLFGDIASGWPGPPPCCAAWTPPDGGLVFELGEFEPYIIDHHDYGWPTREGPRCPGPHASAGAYALAEAPLPRALDVAQPAGRLYACVRVDEGGEVLGVTLIGVKDPSLAQDLTAMIRREWRFDPSTWKSEPGWIRVRLNEGLYEPPAMPPPEMF
jgi:hypothetical protein